MAGSSIVLVRLACHWQDRHLLVEVPVVRPLLRGSPTVMGDLLQQVTHGGNILIRSTLHSQATSQIHPGLVISIDIHIEDPMGGGTSPVSGRSGCKKGFVRG